MPGRQVLHNQWRCHHSGNRRAGPFAWLNSKRARATSKRRHCGATFARWACCSARFCASRLVTRSLQKWKSCARSRSAAARLRKAAAKKPKTCCSRPCSVQTPCPSIRPTAWPRLCLLLRAHQPGRDQPSQAPPALAAALRRYGPSAVPCGEPCEPCAAQASRRKRPWIGCGRFSSFLSSRRTPPRWRAAR